MKPTGPFKLTRPKKGTSLLQEDLAIFKAYSDETRLRILFLLKEGELCVCELVSVLGMPQGKISRHLSVLKHAKLVTDRREGTWIYYALSKTDTPLKFLLQNYLKKAELDMVTEDRLRLKDLSEQGEICIPNPSPVLT